MAVFGQTVNGVHLTLIVANSLTIIFMFLLGRKLSGITGGLVACASYAVMSLSPSVAGLAAHATHFVVLFAVPATLLLLETRETGRRGILFLSGLLYGMAFLMKQHGFCFGLFGWGFLLWQAAQNGNFISADFWKKCFAFGLGMILPFLLTCLVLALAGVFPEFWFWTFTYAHSYVTATPLSEGIRLLHVYWMDTFDQLVGFWMFAAVGLPLAFLKKDSRNRAVFAMVFFLCSFLGTATGLYFRPHYYILMLPAFALIQGMAVASMQRTLRFKVVENVWKSLPVILFSAVLSWVVFYQSLIYFHLTPTQVCQTLYNWNPFVESLPVARYIREHSDENARIAVMGSEPQIYFYAHRHSATGYIYTYALMEPQPNALKMQNEMIREIEAAKPEYMVYVSYQFSWIFQPDSDHTILHWFDGYAGSYYNLVGVVQLNSAGKTEYIWDDEAKKIKKPSGQYIAIYKRKSVLETASVKTN
jgi:4-amino-4-deoxy-L-arabinose transferase-like glycosyltransferase